MRLVLLILPVFAALLVACGSSDPGGSLYVNLGCPRCHGARGDGSQSAPELRGMGATWSSDEQLVAFLKNPQALTESDPRLKALANRYAVQMVAVRGVRDEDLLTLAAWLRSR